MTTRLCLSLTTALSLSLIPGLAISQTQPPATADVVQTYADIAAAAYGDSHLAALALQKAVDGLIAAPSDESLAAARAAWRAARVPYLQTEAFRFGNAIVDDWEGRVNSWPLDEGLIDYVAAGTAENEENPEAALNVIASPRFALSGAEIDAGTITPDLLSRVLHGADGMDANVATGYHAIEFLLWGQDLNGTDPGAGARPFTDFVLGSGCTGQNCDRRVAYLKTATDLLVSDLAEMAGNWAEGGAARQALVQGPAGGLAAILTGMGSLSYGELAGERMKLGLLLNDPEEEQDCFSDNTHNSIYFDALGIQNVYLARYTRLDGSQVSGPAIADLVAAADPALDAQLRAELAATMDAMAAIRAAGEQGFAFDQMIAPGDAQGEALIMAGVNGLVTQTASIQRAVAALRLGDAAFEGSDSLDNPDAVFQ